MLWRAASAHTPHALRPALRLQERSEKAPRRERRCGEIDLITAPAAAGPLTRAGALLPRAQRPSTAFHTHALLSSNDQGAAAASSRHRRRLAAVPRRLLCPVAELLEGAYARRHGKYRCKKRCWRGQMCSNTVNTELKSLHRPYRPHRPYRAYRPHFGQFFGGYVSP